MSPAATIAPEALYPPTVKPPPGPLPTWTFLRRFVDNPLLTLPEPLYHGSLLTVRRPGRVGVWITSPDLIEEVLIRRADEISKSWIERRVFRHSLGQGVLIAEGQHWRWQRRAMAPLFRPGDVLSYVPAFARAAEAMVATWRGDTARPMLRRIDEDMTAVTFDVITTTMLSGIEPAEAVAMKRATNGLLDRSSWEVAYTILGFPLWLWHPAKRQMRRSGDALRQVVAQIIARHRASRQDGAASGDLLAHLMAARDPDTGQAMSDERLVDNLLTLLEAGHETTAKALMWTLYLLARAPDWQDRVRREVLVVCGERAVEAGHLAALQVTVQVIKEAMRLYPPAPVIGRMALKPMVIGGEALPAGSLLVIPMYALHRHRGLWEDPDRFDPERFSPAREKSIRRTQYMPFGAGPRVCIGAQFAMAEATVILATLVRAARFEWDGQHVPYPVSRVTLRAKGGMPLLVSPVRS